MTTELTKPVSRRVGNVIVTITKDGITLRTHRKRKRNNVTVSLDKIAKLGLQDAGVRLTADEWDNPLDSLARLAKHKRLHGSK